MASINYSCRSPLDWLNKGRILFCIRKRKQQGNGIASKEDDEKEENSLKNSRLAEELFQVEIIGISLTDLYKLTA